VLPARRREAKEKTNLLNLLKFGFTTGCILRLIGSVAIALLMQPS
jgi:hypothetical protein